MRLAASVDTVGSHAGINKLITSIYLDHGMCVTECKWQSEDDLEVLVITIYWVNLGAKIWLPDLMAEGFTCRPFVAASEQLIPGQDEKHCNMRSC